MKRIDWLDSARGIGIVLVVIGHTLGGLIDSPIGAGLGTFRALFFAIYTFHMPLFFLLSGLMVPHRLERGTGPFLRGLLPSVVWPYFLWSVVQYTIIFALGSAVNTPVTDYWPVVLAFPWSTYSQFWFLYALFWLHVLAALVVPRYGAGGLLLLALALKVLAPVLLLPVVVRLVCNHALFYAIGTMLAPDGLARVAVERSIAERAGLFPALGVLALAATFMALPQFGGEVDFAAASSPVLSHIAWRFPALGAAVTCTIACIGLGSLRRLAGNALLSALGQLTMPIFVLHVMFVAGTRIALMRLAHLDNPWVLAPLLVLAGLAGPLIVERALRPLGLKRILGF